MKKILTVLMTLVLFSAGVGFAEPTNGRKLTEEELVPTFDLSMTIKSEADFDTVVWFTEWENGKDGKLVAAWEYIIPAKKTTILFLNEKATKKDTWIGFSCESISWCGGFDWWKNAIKKVDKNGCLVYMENGVEKKRQLKRAE